MSAQSEHLEVTNGELAAFLRQHPNMVLVVKKAYDTGCDRAMDLVDDARLGVGIAWMAKGRHTPPYFGHLRVSGNRNVYVFVDGKPVKRLMNLPPDDCLIGAIKDALAGKGYEPALER